MDKFARVYFSILLVPDSLSFCFFAFGCFFLKNERKDLFPMMLIIAFFFLNMVLINAGALISLMRKKKKVIRKTLLMKLCIFFLCFGLFYAVSKIAPASAFMGLVAVLIALVTLGLSKEENKKVNYTAVNRPYNNSPLIPTARFEGYSSKKCYDAAMEELKVKCSREGTDVSEGQDQKVYEYASMPIIYLLKWLVDNNHMSDEFKEQYKDQQWDILELFGNCMDYQLSREDIAPEYLSFIDWYVGDKTTYSLDNPCFMFDYYEAVKNEQGFYYCVEYSDDTYVDLSRTILRRYFEFTGLNRHAEMKTDRKIKWKGKGELDVIAVSGLTDEIINSCEKSLNSIEEPQFRKAERMIYDVYRTDAGNVRFPDDIKPESIVLYGLLDYCNSFTVIGSADFEKEHGVSFSVTDGLITAIGLGVDYEEPWSRKASERQIKAREDLELYKINDNETANDLKNKGALVYIEKEDWYVTPHAAELKHKCDMCIEALEQNLGYLNTEWKCTMREGSLIPKVIYVRAFRDKMLKFSQRIEIWD